LGKYQQPGFFQKNPVFFTANLVFQIKKIDITVTIWLCSPNSRQKLFSGLVGFWFMVSGFLGWFVIMRGDRQGIEKFYCSNQI
jgi:hypothetical protein